MLVSWDQDKGLYDHSTDLGKCVRRLIRANASGSCTQAEDLSDGPDSRVSKGARRGRPLSCVLRGCGKGQLSLSALRRQPIDSWQVFCLVSPNGGYNQLSAGVRVNPTAKTVAFWLVIVLFSALAYQVAHSTKSGATPGISFSEFLSQVDQGNVSEVTILGQEVRGRFKSDKTRFHTTTSVQPAMMAKELQQRRQRDGEGSAGGGLGGAVAGPGALCLAPSAVVHHGPADPAES